MKLFEEFWRIAQPDTDEEEFDEFEVKPSFRSERGDRSERRSNSRERTTERERDRVRERDYDFGLTSSPNSFPSRSNKWDGGKERGVSTSNHNNGGNNGSGNNIVNITTNTSTKVVVMEPRSYSDEVKSIADFLRDRHTIFLNLETTDEDEARRILDFISGVAYAVDGNVKQIASATFVITPFTVTLLDSLVDGLEANGIFNKSNNDL